MNYKNNTDKPTSRGVAVRALGRILSAGELLEETLSGNRQFSELEPRDRAFARLLVSTTLRHLGQIDKVISGFVSRTPPEFVMNVLRIGAAQTLVLGTADHAAVGESVDLVKTHRKYGKFSGLINAVLRKITQTGRTKMAQSAPRDNIPAWIYKSWERSFGRGEARQMALEYLKVPPLDITVKSDPEGWAEKLSGEVVFGKTVRLKNAGRIPELEGFEDGEWWVQDLSSTLPVLSMGDVTGKRVLDMCAAPGGKTLQLASAGAKVTALDRSGPRLKLLQENLKRTQLSATLHETDAVSWDNGGELFDIVLLDAPCSATGTYRRHPDVLHHKSHGQMGELIKLQRRLIFSAVEKLRPDGLLVYCTCSLQVEEGEDQIDHFLQKKNDFEVIRFSDEKWREFGNSGGYLRLLPHQIREKGGLDGFFIARLSRKN